MTLNCLLTGASGFIGSAVESKILLDSSISLLSLVRSTNRNSSHIVKIDCITSIGEYKKYLLDIDVVIHCSSLAHKHFNASEYSKINVQASLNLAYEAAQAGVKRFIFLSTIGVNGNANTVPFTEDDVQRPVSLYANSKYQVEAGLFDLSKKSRMEIVIIRPPLVYGPNAPGNFGRLVSFVEKGIPLPLASINNIRSFVSLHNLVDLIITCIRHPAAANQVFLVADGHDLSTTEFLVGIALAMDKPSRLFSVPSSLLMIALTLLGKQTVSQQLLGSLQVDISKARDLLAWSPPLSVEEGLRRCFVDNAEQ